MTQPQAARFIVKSPPSGAVVCHPDGTIIYPLMYTNPSRDDILDGLQVLRPDIPRGEWVLTMRFQEGRAFWQCDYTPY